MGTKVPHGIWSIIVRKPQAKVSGASNDCRLLGVNIVY